MGEASAELKAVGNIYIPSAEACWDYGIARNAPLLPIIGSLLPYNFLRGVQFDTKVFKLSELVPATYAAIKGQVFDRSARNEVKLTPNWECNDTVVKLDKLFNRDIPYVAGFSGLIPIFKTKRVELFSNDVLEYANLLTSRTVHIALDSDTDFSFKVNNTWKSGEDILTQFITGVANIGKNITENYRTLAGVGTGNANSVAAVPFSQARYSGTDFGELTLSFTLFTRNNYLRDIYLPLLYLQAMCIPKRHPNEQKFKEGMANTVARLEQSFESFIQQTFNTQSTVLSGEDVKKMAGNVMNYFRVVRPPDTFSVEHSSSLFWMKKAAITNFSFKVEGPWVRMEYDALFGKIFNLLNTEYPSSIATALDRLLQDVYVKFIKFPDYCYPTRVKCTMTLKETDFLTLEDWNKRDIGKLTDSIKTSIAAITSPDVGTAGLIAGGIAQNLDILLPDVKGAGDLLSGGKWTPPGESMTGIPGFF